MAASGSAQKTSTNTQAFNQQVGAQGGGIALGANSSGNKINIVQSDEGAINAAESTSQLALVANAKTSGQAISTVGNVANTALASNVATTQAVLASNSDAVHAALASTDYVAHSAFDFAAANDAETQDTLRSVENSVVGAAQQQSAAALQIAANAAPQTPAAQSENLMGIGGYYHSQIAIYAGIAAVIILGIFIVNRK